MVRFSLCYTCWRTAAFFERRLHWTFGIREAGPKAPCCPLHTLVSLSQDSCSNTEKPFWLFISIFLIWSLRQSSSPEKQNQWETYIELFQCFGLGDCGNGKSEIHRAAQETDTAILEQNFFFVEETSVLFLKPLNWLDEVSPDYQT